jgi:hypothetical protein
VRLATMQDDHRRHRPQPPAGGAGCFRRYRPRGRR